MYVVGLLGADGLPVCSTFSRTNLLFSKVPRIVKPQFQSTNNTWVECIMGQKVVTLCSLVCLVFYRFGQKRSFS